MERTDAVFDDGEAMVFRGVALVLFPIIKRIIRRRLHHPLVAVSLRQNRRRSYRQKLRITLYNRLKRRLMIVLPLVAVNDNKLRTHRQ